ncbi:MAG TPA: molybdopterin converting factor subunit 1 [Stellaceae bacterium]|nr:molybdopterin converting factor subunit 1 [Stellaceae bacterium]
MKLLYFAWLRARIGHAEEETTLPEHVRDVAGLLDWLRGRGPAYAEALRDLSVVRVAVNQDYVGREHPVRDGDEVAIFPPVTGG